MKELRAARQLLRLVGEEKEEMLKQLLLSEISISLKKAKEKIDKENSVYKELEKEVKEKTRELFQL